jgi:hypothetical protein
MGLLHSFPSHLFENEEEQQAILVYLACDDAVGWMHELVKHMLAGEQLPTSLTYSDSSMLTEYRDLFGFRGGHRQGC